MIFRDILEHEEKHYTNGDASRLKTLRIAKGEVNAQAEKDFKNGTITKEQMSEKLIAVELLVRSELRNHERQADGNDGLKPEAAIAVESFFKKLHSEALPNSKSSSASTTQISDLWNSHPKTNERVLKQQ
jgi:hypothetical protein